MTASSAGVKHQSREARFRFPGQAWRTLVFGKISFEVLYSAPAGMTSRLAPQPHGNPGQPDTLSKSEQTLRLIWATVTMPGKAKEHGSYVRTVVRAILHSLYRVPCPSQIWLYYPWCWLTVAHVAAGLNQSSHRGENM